MNVKIKLNGGIMPVRQHESDAAYDLYVPEDIVLKSGRQLVDLKFSIEMPQHLCAIIQPRSGYSSKGVEVEWRYKDVETLCVKQNHRINADSLLGLIDSGYRGNVAAILKVNEYRNGTYTLKKGTRIAQMRFVEVPQVTLEQVSDLSDSDRGEHGFGSTNKK
jgi:dUTP pyrophosphatase